MTVADRSAPATVTARRAPMHPVKGVALLRDLRRGQVQAVSRVFESGHDVVQLWLGPRPLMPPVFAVRSTTAVAQVFGAKTYGGFPKTNHFYTQLRLALGDGILTAWGDDWTRQKRFVQPIFTRQRVDGYLDRMVAAIDGLVESWRLRPGVVDVGDGLTELTLEVVADVLFGSDGRAFAETIKREMPGLNDAVLARAFGAVRLPLSVPTPVNRRFTATRAALQQTCDDLIARRRAEPGGDDLASLLIAAHDGEEHLGDDEVRDQVLVFLLAGHETTSTSLTFALHLLGRHRDVQEKVREEVRQVVGDGVPTPAQVAHQLPYTTAVLKETMRLYPAAPLTGRRALDDCELDGFEVPAGSDIVISTWDIHRREDLWPDPLRFDPTRFLGEQPRDRHAWLPFGAGPRACIGQHFSMLESVAALALLVRALTFRAPHGLGDHVAVGSGITLFPLNPVFSMVDVV